MRSACNMCLKAETMKKCAWEVGICVKQMDSLKLEKTMRADDVFTEGSKRALFWNYSEDLNSGLGPPEFIHKILWVEE